MFKVGDIVKYKGWGVADSVAESLKDVLFKVTDVAGNQVSIDFLNKEEREKAPLILASGYARDYIISCGWLWANFCLAEKKKIFVKDFLGDL